MAGVEVQSQFVFGLRPSVKNNLCFLDEQTVIFPSGNSCVRYDIDQRSQKFIPGTQKSKGMQALAISANRRYLAVSESGNKGTITIYDLQHEQSRKRKALNGGELPVQEFVCMAFSPDSKYLIGQGGHPDWTLFYWMWEKQKVMATVNTTSNGSINQVSFNPQDNTQICVCGNKVFKLFRYAEGALKQSNVFKQEINVLSHAWLSEERIIVGTETGRLLLFESGDMRWETTVKSEPSASETHRQQERNSSDENDSTPAALPQVTAIVALSKGFACSAGPGTVCLFEKTEEKDSYRKTTEIQIPPDPFRSELCVEDPQQIMTLCISPSQETLALSTDHSQLYSITLSSAEISKSEHAQFEFLSHPFHSGAITGLSTSIRKPFLATCSLDCSVRIWNFQTNALEQYKEFQEMAYSVALHPSGLHILVGFADKLRLMNLLGDDIRTVKEFTVRSCRECAFSHGGHLFAAVNGNVIHIYSTTTFNNVLNLKGHNGKVRAIVWSSDDSRLVSCGMDGAVYEWNTFTSKRESECVLKSCSYNDVALSPDGKTIFAVGNDFTLKEIQDCQILKEVGADEVSYTAIAVSYSGRTVFTGTSTGTVRVIKHPLSFQKDWTEHQAHSAPVTKMVITFDDQFLLTASEDGCLFIWRIIDKEGQGLKRDKDIVFSEEILITKSDLVEKNQIIADLKTRVEELQMNNEYQLRLKGITYNDQIKELTEKFTLEMESLKTKIQVLKMEREKQEITHRETLAEVMEKCAKEKQDLESTKNQRLMAEYERYDKLQLKLQHMQEEHKQQLQSLEERRNQAMEELADSYEVKLQETKSLLDQSQDVTRQQVLEFEEWKKQVEEDIDEEVLQMRVRYERKLQEEKETNMRLKGETGVMKKKIISLQRETEDKNVEIEKLKQEQQKLRSLIESIEKDIMGLRKEIQERDETIEDKETRITDLKKENQEMMKFKFVLRCKIKEMEENNMTQEDEIAEMKKKIQEMDAELEQVTKKNTQLELKIADMKLRLSAGDKEMSKERQRVKDLERLVERFKTDLHNCVSFIQKPKELKDCLHKLYEHYVQESDVVEVAGMGADVQEEQIRQREHLERTVASLKKRLAKDVEVHHANKIKLIKENVILIKELNDLRDQLRRSQTQLSEAERQLRLSKKDKMKDSAELGSKQRLNFEEEAEKIIQMQRVEMERLRQQIQGQGEGSVLLQASPIPKLPPIPN
ncbi:cilia- and flagella-associated protein 57 [Chanos chanos]|uniref:Cilia- and flagella-associated protein 57 n=1 Tax=Chanos chanos TaxID=29144 RepID=A0A6J2VFP8_CHACN|nr:cilia- and flagella-associated protein 57 [Chanos chanos]